MVTLDTNGRLVGLETVPEREAAAMRVDVLRPWDKLLALADLESAALRETDPGLLPPFYAHERMAWAGQYSAGLELRAEAAQPVDSEATRLFGSCRSGG